MTDTELTIEQRALDIVKQELNQYSPKQIDTVLALLEDGNTVPFIARYRKDQTGSLDEVQIREIEERHRYLVNFEKRKDEVIRLIDEQEKLTDEILSDLMNAKTLTALEDIYRPFKQKKRTKATIAKEAGLEPLAEFLLACTSEEVEAKAATFINEEKEILTVEDALNGALEIIAEKISDNAHYRKLLREYTIQKAMLVTSLKDEEKDEKHVYEMYYEYQELVKTIVPHRILAVNRAEKEGVLKVSLEVDETIPLEKIMKKEILNVNSPSAPYVKASIEDSYKRFVAPAIEREIRSELTEKAQTQAIEIFGENLQNLLLQAPMKGHVILGLDPAYRTGCKLAIIDETGKVLDKAVIYPHQGASDFKRAQAGTTFKKLLEDYQVTLVAIGNGTASRESEAFVSEQIKGLNRKIYYTIVSEAGASVYSASEIARKEFPDYQVEERSAVSIARRLQDPLAELVKIDPKAVGVGQYQHDVSQKQLDARLDIVVETAVNKVGVNVNTASAALLEHIAGLTKTTAANVVAFRDENGKFTNRSQLKKVPRLGPKAFEQAVGFLRIVDGKNPLDGTDIHPESYEFAEKILDKIQAKKVEIGTEKVEQALSALDKQALSSELGIGIETLELIFSGLTKPGRDPREEVDPPILRSDVLSMEDIQVGMELQGTIRNVVDFGAFVDIGVKQDGLVHISRMKKGFVKHPSDVVAVGDIVTVWVTEIDMKKGRVSLSMLPPKENEK
ncbi:MAG: Tex family protein [Granulicatella sp.]